MNWWLREGREGRKKGRREGRLDRGGGQERSLEAKRSRQPFDKVQASPVYML